MSLCCVSAVVSRTAVNSSTTTGSEGGGHCQSATEMLEGSRVCRIGNVDVQRTQKDKARQHVEQLLGARSVGLKGELQGGVQCEGIE
jgi:hypothetical protein